MSSWHLYAIWALAVLFTKAGNSVGTPIQSRQEATAESYLPDLGFWTDLTGLFLGRSPTLSPVIRLSRGLFESQKCVEYVACEMSRLSRRHSPFQFIHTFLEDLPFQGDIASRLQKGTDVSKRLGDSTKDNCGFRCSPMDYLNRGVKTLSLLHSVMEAAQP